MTLMILGSAPSTSLSAVSTVTHVTVRFQLWAPGPLSRRFGNDRRSSPRLQRAGAFASSRVTCSSTLERGPAGPSEPALIGTDYRRCVGICVVNKDGLIFAARRLDDVHKTWQMPQGGIDPGENPMVAAVRELKEETGISSATIIGQIDQWLAYDFPTSVRSQLTGSFLQFRGQTQKWFLMRFDGDEAEIDLENHGEREFTEYAWLPLEQLPSKVVDFKQEVYKQVAREFGPRVQDVSKKLT